MYFYHYEVLNFGLIMQDNSEEEIDETFVKWYIMMKSRWWCVSSLVGDRYPSNIML